MKCVIIAALGRAHGLRGELAMHPFNPDSELWSGNAGSTPLFILPVGTVADPSADSSDVVDVNGAEQISDYRIRSIAKGKRVISLRECRDRTTAEGLRGRLLAIEVDALKPASDDEFFYYEISGWTVSTEDGVTIGRVVRAFQTHVDLLEVAPEGGGETFFIPVISDVVKCLDRTRQHVVIDPIEGLLP